MKKASLQSLQIVAESIAKVYMNILKQGKTPENEENLEFLFDYENGLYKTLSFDDCQEYRNEIKKQNPKLEEISIIDVCLGHFCLDANARVLERLSYIRDYKSAFPEETVKNGETYSFCYAHYTKFFLYLVSVYKQYQREMPFSNGLALSYLNLIYTYNYAEVIEKNPDFSYDEETLQKFVGSSSKENNLIFKEVINECLGELKEETVIFETNNNDYLAKLTFKMFLEANYLCLTERKEKEAIIEKVQYYILKLFQEAIKYPSKEFYKDKVTFFQELEVLFDCELEKVKVS